MPTTSGYGWTEILAQPRMATTLGDEASTGSDRSQVVDVAGCEGPLARCRPDQQAAVAADRTRGAEHCRAVREFHADRTAEGDADRLVRVLDRGPSVRV